MSTELTREAEALLDHLFGDPSEGWYRVEHFVVCDDGRYRHLVRVADVENMVESAPFDVVHTTYGAFCDWVPAIVNGTDSKTERCRQLARLRSELDADTRRNLCSDLFLID